MTVIHNKHYTSIKSRLMFDGVVVAGMIQGTIVIVLSLDVVSFFLKDMHTTLYMYLHVHSSTNPGLRSMELLTVHPFLSKHVLNAESPMKVFSNSEFCIVRNTDFNIPCYSTIRNGKHSIRYMYLGRYLCSKLSSSDQQQP